MSEDDPVRLPNVSSDVREKFRSYVRDKHGTVKGVYRNEVETALKRHMGDDRLDDVLAKLNDLEEQLDGDTPPTSNTDTKNKKDSNGNRTERRLSEIMADIRSMTGQYAGPGVREDDIRKAIQDNAGTSAPTIRKYRQLLIDRKCVFPNPLEENQYFVKPTAFIAFLENNRDKIPDGDYWEVRNEYGEDWWQEQAPQGLLNEDTHNGFQ